VMPEFERTAGVEQLGVHELDVATHSVLAAVNLAGVMDEAQHLFPGHANEIDEYLSAPEVRAGLVLAALFHDLGKPECRTWEGQRWRFFGHAERGVELAGGLMDRLRLPKRVRRQVTLLVGSHMRLIPYISTDDPTERAKRRLIHETAPDTIGVALLCIADWRALRRDSRVDDEELALDRLRGLLALAREMEAEGEAIEPLLNGSDLLALGLEPGPLFGRILRAVDEEWVAGNLNSKSQALAWVRSRWAAADQQQTHGAETNRPGGKAGNGGPRSV
jgi:poly(A) polymerase